jgi:DNA-binding transcriptional MocR family regulator
VHASDGTHRLYERLADELAASIQSGALRPGDRLPSVRSLSRQQRVSVSTVLEAYVRLENQGLVEVRPQSGHYVRLRRSLLEEVAEPRAARPSMTPTKVSIRERVMSVYGAVRDPGVVQLGAAYLSPELLPAEKLGRMLGAVARSAPGIGVSYDPPPGFAPLRRLIARRSLDWGCRLAPDDIVTTVGAIEGLQLCLRAVTKAGDKVVVESPTYYGMLQLIESMGLKAIEVPVRPRSGIDLDALQQVLRAHRVKACLLIPNFNNPLGSLLSDADKAHLVRLLSEREIPLIEDDIYGDLYFGAARPRPAKAFDRDGFVMLCSSFSKTLAPGYRVGWTAPGRFRAQVELLKFVNTVGTPTLPQMAIAEFLETGGYDHHLRRLRRVLEAQVEQFRAAIVEHFPEGTRISRPLGGFLLWIELPPRADAFELHSRALERGISIAPGALFSAKQRYKNCLRLSCGFAWSERFERSIRSLGEIARSLERRRAM